MPPLPIMCERPRTACADPTKMWLALRGSTTIPLMPRPRNASLPGVDAGVGRVADALVGELLPVVAAVRRLVDADASLTAGRAAVALAGAEVERVVLLVGRIQHELTDRVLVEILWVDLLPHRIGASDVVRPPDAAARGAGPDAALVRRTVGVGDERHRPARRDVGRTAEGQHAGLDGVLLRAVALPLVPLVRCGAAPCAGARPAWRSSGRSTSPWRRSPARSCSPDTCAPQSGTPRSPEQGLHPRCLPCSAGRRFRRRALRPCPAGRASGQEHEGQGDGRSQEQHRP